MYDRITNGGHPKMMQSLMNEIELGTLGLDMLNRECSVCIDPGRYDKLIKGYFIRLISREGKRWI